MFLLYPRFTSKDDCIGDDVMTDGETNRVKEARLAAAYKIGLEARQADRDLTETTAAGIDSTPPERVAYLAGAISAHKPTFDPYLNDVWRKRSKVHICSS